MKPLTHHNLHSFCRTCLLELDKQSEKYNIRSGALIEWIVSSCLDGDKNDDGHPHFVCQQCYDKLQRCHEFRTMAKRSMRILTDLLALAGDERSQKTKKDLYGKLGNNENLETHELDEMSHGNKDWLEFDYNKKSPAIHFKFNAMTQVMETEVFLNESNEYKKEDETESEMEMELPQSKSDFNDSSDLEPLSQLSKHTTLEGTPNDSQFEDSEEDENGEDYVEGDDVLLSGDFDYSNQSLNPPRTGTPERTSVAESNAKVVRTSSKRTRRANHNSPAPAPTKKFEVKFQCTRCPRRCITEENLEAHMRTHQGLKPFQCQSVGCGRSFNRACHMRIHMREVHSESQEKIICTYEGCGKVFCRDASYRVHYRFKHSESKPNWKIFVCEDCGRTFKNITTLREHRYKHVPEAEYPFQCEHCGKRYTSQRTYKEHLMRHAGIKNFECPFCGMKKTTRNELRTHINYHTKERQWPCPQCPSVFNSSANLGMHDRVVHKGIRRYACRYCDQSFGKADTLKHHEMRHTGEKPHECNICNKRFIQIVALRAHMKTHNKTAKQQHQISATHQPEHNNGPQTQVATSCMQSVDEFN